MVEDYLEIQRARFGDRLRYRLDIPAALAEAAVPPFSIQTLVENSVKFAVEPRLEGGEVRVAARAEGGRLEVAVSDDGPGFRAIIDGELPKGHGLDNLRSRLLSLFGAEGRLEIGGSRVLIGVPYRREAHADPPA